MINLAKKFATLNAPIITALFIFYFLFSLFLAVFENDIDITAQLRMAAAALISSVMVFWLIGVIRNISLSSRLPPVISEMGFCMVSYMAMFLLILFVPWVFGFELDKIPANYTASTKTFFFIIYFIYLSVPILYITTVIEIIRAEKQRNIQKGGFIITFIQIFYLPLGIFWLKPRLDNILSSPRVLS